PSLSLDTMNGVWLISSFPLYAAVNGAGVIVNCLTDAGSTFGNPIVVSSQLGSDKNCIVCDNTPTSPFYGHCYIEWDNNGASNLIEMNTSTDGGLTWGPSTPTANNATGIGGQPLVQPSGRVVVPMNNAFETTVEAFNSTNGGLTWTAPVLVSNVS